MKQYLGIDLGGTNIAAGLVDGSGNIRKKDSVPTLNRRPYQEIVRDMAELGKKIAAEAGCSMDEIAAVGVGCPGCIDNQNGVVSYANNLPFDNTPLREELQKYFDLPINLENDANAAAYGEYSVSGEGVEDFVAITLGTGVGGGIIVNKKIYRGFNGAGAELGHFTLVHNGEDCTCGKHGCWEAYASVTALIRQTKEAMAAHPDSIMHDIVGREGHVSGRTAFVAAKQGDAAGQEVVHKYIEYVADGITSVVNIFQPEILAIGGGISREGDYLLKPIQEYVDRCDYNKYLPRTKIQTATLFNDAGIIGAALAAKSELE